MSRSFKHNGWIQDQSCKKHGKRFANKRVRRSSEVVSGCNYKRVYNSWDISDYLLSCRGKLIKDERRPGRKFLKVVPGGYSKSWWWIDFDDLSRIWRDWRK